ncbi:MAG: DUF1223 domain-containing protein [Lysobacterales bacterium]
MRILVLTILSTLNAAELSAAPLRCELSANGTPPQRVELYTSEGCSSCPPADRWLSGLKPADQRMLLAFHVDYWDDLGWPDRFADARFSQRQRELAARARSRTVYTPEVAVEGREFRGWRQGLPQPAVTAGLPLTARILIDNGVEVELLPAAGYPTGAKAHLAITEDGLYTQVRAGENRGQQLRHDHVVRAFAQPMPLSRPLRVKLPSDLNPDQARLNLWVEDAQWQTLQALSAALGVCDSAAE